MTNNDITLPQSATALYDAGALARAWLSVALASATDAAVPALQRTVSVEHYTDGVRLVASDGYVLLRSFVPNLDAGEFTLEPALDIAPEVAAVAIDGDGRGKGLCGYLLKLARQVEKDGGNPVIARLSLGVVEPDDEAPPVLDGMEPVFVVLEHHPDHERLKLPTYGGDYPSWRKVTAGFTHRTTGAVALNTDIIGRLAKLGKLHDGKALLWHFGGAERMAIVEVAASRPYVEGAVMPARWDFDADAPLPLEDDGAPMDTAGGDA